MSTRKLIFSALVCCAVFSGCNRSTPNAGGFIPLRPPDLSWTATWVQGSQTGTITFQSVGQNATLSASAAQPGGSIPPYTFTSGSCVTLSNESTSGNTENVTVTAASAGSCSVTVSATGSSSTSIRVTVP